jgi:dipeptidyl aminopeptidase/acylaminoacyl peptidase
VESAAGDLVWSVIDEWRNSGLGLTYPAPLHWSADGRYLYYSNVPTVDGCAAFVNGGDLWRLDLTDGTTTELLPYIEMVLALSPDSQQVAYHRAFGGGFYLHDLATGAETPVDLPHHDDSWQVGGLTWSPDGQQILLTQVLNPCGESLTAVTRLDLTDNSLATLLPPDERNFTLLNWLSDREIGLLAEDGSIWYLDTATGEIVGGTPLD